MASPTKEWSVPAEARSGARLVIIFENAEACIAWVETQMRTF